MKSSPPDSTMTPQVEGVGEGVAVSEMVERVARAICATNANCVRARVLGEPCVDATGRIGPCVANDAQLALSGRIDMARAAIEAMREMSVDMRSAGRREFQLHADRRDASSDQGVRMAREDVAPQAIHNAIILAALGDLR